MDRILIILKKENGPRASSAPALGLNTIIFKHVYWYMQQTQVSVYRTIGPLVLIFAPKHRLWVLVRTASAVYLFFLFLLQNIDCGYSLELPRRGGSNVYPQSMF